MAVRTLKARVAQLETSQVRGDAIAVVGIGCRFPGARGPEAFWQTRLSGEDRVAPVPASRWDPSRWSQVPAQGAFLEDIDRFDAAFFGISTAEAAEMDPAQRLLLETAWHAFEDAQIDPTGGISERTGVWLGLGLSDYSRRRFGEAEPDDLTPYTGTGVFLSVAAGRIAYALGLNGPALTVDTACSSSLVSTHLAMQSLRSGEVDLALSAGANVLLSPMPSAYFAALGALASDGRCKTFSEDADGYGRGEGVGVLVLKRLDDAVRDGDPIRAVLRGSAVNQDGASNGLTAPSGRAQQAVLRAALDDAGLAPEDVQVIEAHGTGTPLGDPIELDALRAVLGDAFAVSSVKTQFAHTETAAGIAGLISAILSLEAKTLAPHLHLTRPNPRLQLEDTDILIPESALPWPDLPRRVGVSSFGLSGTNAHVIVEAAPEPEPVHIEGPGLILLSARSEEALSELSTVRGDWRALECTSVRRAALPYRMAAAGRDANQLWTALENAPLITPTGGRLAWVFTGQGSQWPAMGAVLRTEPRFAEVVERVCAVVPGLEQAWFDGGPEIHHTRWTQPALYALQCGLAALTTAHGITPDAVLGHSIGAYAAAHLAGVFTLEDGARLVEARGRLMGDLPTGGEMLVVFSPPVDDPHGTELAARNHPNQCVYSGPSEAILALETGCAALGIESRRLTVSHAFHSAAMDPMLEPYLEVVRATELRRPALRMISSVDGLEVGERATDPQYWVDQLRKPVAFVDALSTLSDHPFFLELGPHPVLSPAIARTLPAARVVPTLHRDGDDAAIWAAAAALWTHGVKLNARRDRPRVGRAPLAMPFARDRHWIDHETHVALHRQVWQPAMAPRATVSGTWWVIANEPRWADAFPGEVVRLKQGELLPQGTPDGVLVVEDARRPLRLGTEVHAALAVLQQVDAPLSAVVFSDRPSGLPGLMRVLRNERPERAGALIWDPDSSEQILPELAARTPEVRLSLGRTVPGWEEVASEQPPTGEGTAWITGAGGDLGRALAHEVANRFDQVVLLSRSGVPEADLVALGSHVRSIAGDVTGNLVPLAVEAPPDVIFHLAGVLEDRALERVTEEQLDRVGAPKIEGAWTLHEVAPDTPLVLVGSAAAQLGNPGQAAYAAANAWLEGFASWRRTQGAPTWCVALGPIAGTRMVRGLDLPRQLSLARAVDFVLQAPSHDTAVLLAADPPRTEVAVVPVVESALREVLGRLPGPNEGFFDAGLDSVMAQDLRARLSRALGRSLPVSLVFEAPTRSALITTLEGRKTPAEAPAKKKTSDAVAIVGMAVRFPGAEDLDAFWTLLEEGRDGVREVDRWKTGSVRHAGLLQDIAGFDADRFGISPREAARMDPQQRLVLEASAEALAHAGLDTASTGVFVGIGASEYGRRFDPFDADPYDGTGNVSSFAAGRVSHALALTGPAMCIDTACSSSLVALHLAKKSLMAGECEVALAGGVHVLAGPESTAQLTALGALSPTGRCHTFSEAADGYVRGEGVGMVVLKSLAAAERDGDVIWAVLEGSAVNHDGRSAGVTVPNGNAQRAVLRSALTDAGLEGGDIDVLEAHGTGTPLGDPIEIDAVRDVLLEARERPLAIGSVKTNLGHLEAGAGIAGLVKAVWMLHHQRLAPHLHLGTPNPELTLDGIHIPTSSEPWSIQHAGISSFGISGTNAHVILGRHVSSPVDQAPRSRVLQVHSSPVQTMRSLPPLSGAQALQLTRRRKERWRAWSVGGPLSTPNEAVAGGVAWLFTGQGSQFEDMHEALLEEPVFAEAWQRAELGPVEDIHHTGAAQPALFAYGWAKAQWLLSRGLVPDRLMGHSLGELIAATVAGVWTFEDALALVRARGEILGSLPAGGASAAILASLEEVEAVCGDAVDIAGVNGPTEVVIAGTSEAVDAVLAKIDAPVRRLKVSHPFHSRHMEPAVERFRAEVEARPAKLPRWPLFSNLDGQRVGERALDPSYWASLVRRAVRFHDGLTQLETAGTTVFLEIGPRPVLTGMVQRCLPHARAIATRSRDGDALDDLYGAVGELWVAGIDPDWFAVTGASGVQAAPPPPMVHSRHWIDAEREQHLPRHWFYEVTGLGEETHDLVEALAAAQAGDWRPSLADPAVRAVALAAALESPGSVTFDDPARLRSATPTALVSLRPEGHYLVTGGTGSLGRALVDILRGEARTVHVLSRSGTPVEGAISHALDVSDADALAVWLKEHPVHGVVHAAGVGRKVLLADEDGPGLQEVLGPKAARFDTDLDFYVAISSIAAVWGSTGQAAYGAANARMLSEVRRQRQAGVDARWVALGPVRGGLLDEEGERWLAERGVRALDPDQAAAAALRAEGVVADVDWPRFLPIQTARVAQPLFEALQPAPTTLPRSTLAAVHEAAARVLGRTAADLPVDRGLFDAGMDSVTAVELARALSTEDQELPATLVFEHGTVAGIAAFLKGATPVRSAPASATGASIVIVGMGCRFPGGVESPEDYWALLSAGTDTVSPVPADRWDAQAVYAPEPTPGCSYVRHGAFVSQVADFDPLFFGLSPREAESLDPQQRLLLEVSWQALERAGLIRERSLGIFVGIPESSYLQRFESSTRYPNAWAGTGNESSFAAGRVAHALGAQGPAVALNTACSSSLVTVHLAAAALRNGDCDAALAGGVSLMLSADNHIYLSQLQALAPDGRCKTFSPDADGYGRGEGAGVVVLMREDEARERGLPILARLLGSAVNHDGPSSGLTVPNGSAQEAVIRQAVERAGVDPAQITCIEAHGTGTQLGDPIEIRALQRALGDTPRWLASVKTQLGHLEQAAGAAALIKVVLQHRHGAVAAHLHASEPVDTGALRIPQALEPWQGIAGVSGFGLSGTNAHLVIGPGEVFEGSGEGPRCWSAASEGALQRLRTEPMQGPTLWARRHLGVRAYEDGPARRIDRAPRLVLLFTGQGSQSPGMDDALYRREPVYRETFDQLASMLQFDRVWMDERVHRTRATQRALFAMEWALATWWRSIGIEADLVAGHSIGEITAAAWAGLLSLEDAVRLVSVRADAMSALPPGGAMAAVFADEPTVRAALGKGCEIAGVNTDDETVITGTEAAVDAVLATLEGRRLTVSHAFHSAAMQPACDRVDGLAATLTHHTPRIPVVRNLDGALHENTPTTYWARQLREAVRFADGVRTLQGLGATTWLEVGPKPVLARAVRRLDPTALAVGGTELRDIAGELWTGGIDVPMGRWMTGGHAILPTTPFERTRCWLDLPEKNVERPVLYALEWEPGAATAGWTGETVRIEPGTVEEIWAQLTATSSLAASRTQARFVTAGQDWQRRMVEGFVRAARRELELDWRSSDGDSEIDDPWVRDGKTARLRAASPTVLEPVGVTLITGGAGGIGTLLAEHLEGEVLLLSRSGPLAADVRDVEALRRVLDGRAIDRVLHAAGVLCDGPLGQAWQEVSDVFSVKLEGALALREVLGDEVEYVFFSSASAVLGAPGQTAYAAANAALDGLAEAWKQEGLRVRSLAWGPWQVGMAATLDPTVRTQQASLGLSQLTTEQALSALGSEGLVLPMHWPRYLATHGEPLYTALGWRPAAAPTAPVSQLSLDALPAWLETTAREVLRIPEGRALPSDQPLQDFGLDSLMAITLRNRLVDTGFDVPVARLIGGPSIEEIVAIARAQRAPTVVETEPITWFHPLVTHALLAILALLAGALIGASLLGVQTPERPTATEDRAPRADR